MIFAIQKRHLGTGLRPDANEVKEFSKWLKPQIGKLVQKMELSNMITMKEFLSTRDFSA